MADFPPAAALPDLTLRGDTPPAKEEISRAVDDWLAALQKRLEQRPNADVADLFVQEAWWRDIIALYWDFHTRSGVPAIAAYLNESQAGFGELEAIRHGGLAPRLENDNGLRFILAGFTFRTKFGGGRGILRMANVAPGEWKAWTVSTHLEELNGQTRNGDGPRGLFFPNGPVANGVTNGHTNGATNGDAHDEHVPVVIVGGGTRRTRPPSFPTTCLPRANLLTPVGRPQRARPSRTPQEPRRPRRHHGARAQGWQRVDRAL